MKVVKNIALLSIVQLINNALPLLSVPAYSRIIGPDKFGIINFAASFVAYFTLLIGYGFDVTAVRKLSSDADNEEKRNFVFSEVFFTQILLFLFCFLIFGLLYFTVPVISADRRVMLFSFILCIATVFTQNWLFQAMQDLKIVAYLNFFCKLLFTISIILIIKHKSDYFYQPLLISATQILIGITSFAIAIRKYRIKIVPIPIIRLFKLLWTEKFVFFSLVIDNFYSITAIFLLGILSGNVAVGYYTGAYKFIFIMISLFTMPLSQALFPYMGTAFAKKPEFGIEVAQRIIPVVVIIALCFSICLYYIGGNILLLFYGRGFASSIGVFKILAFVPVLVCLKNVLGIQVMLNIGMDKAFFNITFFTSLFGIILCFPMIRVWGYIGAAVNWILIELIIIAALYSFLSFNGVKCINLNFWKLSNLILFIRRIRGNR